MFKNSPLPMRALAGLVAINAAIVVTLAPALAADSVKVLVTIKPIHALVAQVMGDTGTPELLVGGTASPHTYVMKPSDAKKLSSANIVFRVSGTIDAFIDKATASLPNTTDVVALALAPGVTTLPQRAGGPFEPDHHDSHAHGLHEQADDHDHDHGAMDGHVWLDPANAQAMLDLIAAKLAVRWPERAALYRSNADAAKSRIDQLTTDITTELAPVSSRPYVVFHDAYQYFEKRFGLVVAGSITVNPEIPPSGQRLAKLREKINKLGATCVFGEPNFDAKVIATVIEGSAARGGTLDPEGASLPPGPGLYENLMRNLAAGIKGCLAPS